MGGVVISEASYELVLKCRFCDLVPDAAASIEFLTVHFESEHADLAETDETGRAKAHLDLVARHVPCEALCEPIRPDKPGRVWKCPECHEVFTVHPRRTQ